MACMLESKPVIAYPAQWKYKVIIECATQKREKIDEVLASEEYSLKFSKFSNGGKYASFDISVLVANEAHRLGVFEKLKKNFKFVL